MDANEIFDRGINSGEQHVQEAGAKWAAQLATLTQSFASWCPSWEVDAGSDDFPTTEHLKALLANPKYKQQTPVANILDGMMKASPLLVKAGVSPIFGPRALNEATVARGLGYTTTSLTVCGFKAYVELPKIAAGKSRAAEVGKLRKARQEHTTQNKAT